DDQLALAICKEGMNARLAARLTGWKVDIQTDSEIALAEADAAFGGGDSEYAQHAPYAACGGDQGESGEDYSGRCAAILTNGKRCPNAALPGSRFCGVQAHQELAVREAAGEDLTGSGVEIGA